MDTAHPRILLCIVNVCLSLWFSVILCERIAESLRRPPGSSLCLVEAKECNLMHLLLVSVSEDLQSSHLGLTLIQLFPKLVQASRSVFVIARKVTSM